jgi:hypothetical protein
METVTISAESFNPSSVNIETDDFLSTKNKCDNFIGTNQIIASKDSPDNYSL